MVRGGILPAGGFCSAMTLSRASSGSPMLRALRRRPLTQLRLRSLTLAKAAQPSPARGEGDSLGAEIKLRRIFRAFDFLDDGLAADHALVLRVVGQSRRAVELPAAVESFADAVAEGRIVRSGEIAIEIHRDRPQ